MRNRRPISLRDYAFFRQKRRFSEKLTKVDFSAKKPSKIQFEESGIETNINSPVLSSKLNLYTRYLYSHLGSLVSS